MSNWNNEPYFSFILSSIDFFTEILRNDGPLQHDAVGDDPDSRLRCDAGAGTADRKPADVPELHPGPVQLFSRLLCSTGIEIIGVFTISKSARSSRSDRNIVHFLRMITI